MFRIVVIMTASITMFTSTKDLCMIDAKEEVANKNGLPKRVKSKDASLR